MFNKSFGAPFGGGTGAFGTSSTFGQQSKLICVLKCFMCRIMREPRINTVQRQSKDILLPMSSDTGFGAAGGFGSSAFGATNNTGGLFGTTQNKPGNAVFCSYRCVQNFFNCSKNESLQD